MRSMRWPTADCTSIDVLTNASANSLIMLGTLPLSCPMIVGLFLKAFEQAKQVDGLDARRVGRRTIRSGRTDTRRRTAFLRCPRKWATTTATPDATEHNERATRAKQRATCGTYLVDVVQTRTIVFEDFRHGADRVLRGRVVLGRATVGRADQSEEPRQGFGTRTRIDRTAVHSHHAEPVGRRLSNLRRTRTTTEMNGMSRPVRRDSTSGDASARLSAMRERKNCE
jgi:hypothetical protein